MIRSIAIRALHTISSLKKSTGKIFFVLVLCMLVAIFFIPTFSFALGNIFFGGVKPLYNLQLAQFFYKSSVNTLSSTFPPRYAHYQLSRTYFIEGKLYDALDEANTELKIYPDDTVTYYIVGLTYGYMNRTHEAIDAFSKYIKTHPDTWPGRNDKAWLQFRIGDIDGAIQTIKPVVESFRYTVWVQNTYCALLIAKKSYNEAEKYCTYAKEDVDRMSSADWGHAYPGNDPRIYNTGLQAMKVSIEQNLKLIEDMKKHQPTRLQK